MHKAWPSRDWYCPAAHASQCAAEVTAPDPAILPAAHAMQEGWPPAASYLPCGQTAQLSLFCAAEYLPAAHAAHTRSDVALDPCATRAPAKHTVCTRQAACPAESWNSLPTHALHDVAASASEYRPIAHSSHTRSVLVVGAAVSYEPLRQICTLRHTVFPDSRWNCPPAQALHEVLALAFWIWPAGHAWQYAVAFWLTAPEP